MKGNISKVREFEALNKHVPVLDPVCGAGQTGMLLSIVDDFLRAAKSMRCRKILMVSGKQPAISERAFDGQMNDDDE